MALQIAVFPQHFFNMHLEIAVIYKFRIEVLLNKLATCIS